MKPSAARRVKEARDFLFSIQIPPEQQNERSALTLLALGNITSRSRWMNSEAPLRRVTEIIDWIRTFYGVPYAPNTRETIRRQTIHQFIQHGLLLENPDKADRPINSPKWCYQLTPGALRLMQCFGTRSFQGELDRFLTNASASTASLYPRHRELPKETVRLPNGNVIELSAGGQNTLIRSIVEEFAPRFVKQPQVLLLGDAANKEAVSVGDKLSELGVVLQVRGKAPDVLIHDQERDWLIIVEAVTSHGPINQKRKNELTSLFLSARPGMVFVTAFPDRKTFSRFHSAIAWETEVWIADAPDHLIHFNGERFLGPYSK